MPYAGHVHLRQLIERVAEELRAIATSLDEPCLSPLGLLHDLAVTRHLLATSLDEATGLATSAATFAPLERATRDPCEGDEHGVSMPCGPDVGTGACSPGAAEAQEAQTIGAIVDQRRNIG